MATALSLSSSYSPFSAVGVLANSAVATSATLENTGSFTIGAEGSPSDFFNGTLDDIRAYNRALSADEVKQLYLMVAELSPF